MGAIRALNFLAPELHPTYTAVCGHLAQQMGQAIPLQASADEAVLYGDTWELAFVCGGQVASVLAQGAALNAIAAPVTSDPQGQGQPIYFSHVVVREDIRATDLLDLRGARLCINEPRSFSGCIALEMSLDAHGLPPSFFHSIRITGSHKDSLACIKSGQCDVTPTDSQLWWALEQLQPDTCRGLRVVTSLGPYPAPPVVCSQSAAPTLRDALQKALANITASKIPALAAAGISHYAIVDNTNYATMLRARRVSLGAGA